MTGAPTVVCVLGMHRSGTSVVAAMLERFGIYLGAPHLWLTPLPENPLGYWEHRGIKALNEELLHRLGGSWHTLPPLPSGWADAPALADLRERARALLAADFGAHLRWGWKDPRACVLLPFWAPLLPPMRYVLCVRHPHDVARSLAARDDLPFDHAQQLWLAHHAAALAHTQAAPRVIVHYEALFTAPGSVAASLATLLDHKGPLPDLADLVDTTLRHHAAGADAAVREAQLLAPVRSLYDALRGPGATGSPEAWSALVETGARAMDAQLLLESERGTADWFVRHARSTTAPAVALAPTLGEPMRVSAARQHARDYLEQRPALGRMYRQLRRSVRRALRLGP